MIKLCTFYTESHAELFDQYFLASYQRYSDNQIEMLKKIGEQKCVSAKFHAPGLTQTTLDKILFIIDVLKNSEKESIIIYSDPDVIFLSEFLEDCLIQLEDNDIACQRDWVDQFCTGFMVIKNSNKVIDLFLDVANNITNKSSDQFCFNKSIKTNKFKDNIKIKFLNDQYVNIHHYLGKITWKPDIAVPWIDVNNIKMFHANCTVGIDNKIKLLNQIQKIINAYQVIQLISNRNHMSYKEYEYICKYVFNKKLLVFGCGNDSKLWRSITNKAIFIEHNDYWIDKTYNDILKIKYSCHISEANNLLQNYIKNKDNSELYLESLEHLKTQNFDAILVDSPEGYHDQSIGRMQSIYMAYYLANHNTDVFIHDINRKVEKTYSSTFFSKNISTINRLGHFQK